MKNKLFKMHGFTIVELLVVIVVISVLAAIVTVGYGGIQRNARNTKITSVVNAYKNALIQYAIEKGTYPPGSPACLGDDYPESGVFTDASGGRCGRSNSRVNISVTFNDAIKPYLSNSVPTPSNTIFGDGAQPWSVRGASFRTNISTIIDGVSHPWVLMYYIEGANKCPVGPLIRWLSTYPNVTLNPPEGYFTLISGGTVGVECWIPMPDPSKL